MNIHNSIFKDLQQTPNLSNSIDLNEFQCLNPRQLIYNNIIEIYISILLLKHDIKNGFCFTCEIGMEVFNNTSNEKRDIFKFDKKIEHIIMPIYRNTHYTFVYINLLTKEFQFVDPQVATEDAVIKQFENFKNNVHLNHPNEWK